jgi:DNA polymerase III sliding clamp (beta) subunit (PCNA family)
MDANHLVIADGQGTAGTLRIIDPDEMPGRPDTTKWTVMGRMSTRVLADMIVRAIPFCADDMARQILTGVKVRTSADKITFCATDNYVITCLDGVLYDGAEATVAVPAASLKLLGGLLSDDNDITLRVDGTRFNVAWGQYDLTIAGIDGQFPNYEQVIPRYSPWDGEAGSYGITVDRKALLKALKLTRKCDPIVHVVTGGESITVKIPDPNDGAYETLFAKSLPATVTPAQDVRIGFNPALLTLVLNTIAAPTVTLFRNDPGVLVAFGIDTGDPSSRYAVMPVKLGNL